MKGGLDFERKCMKVKKAYEAFLDLLSSYFPHMHGWTHKNSEDIKQENHRCVGVRKRLQMVTHLFKCACFH